MIIPESTGENMSYQFVKVWVVTSGDGYTSKPVAYFTTKPQAQMWLQSQKDNIYLSLSAERPEAIQIGNRTWLLGDAIDLDHVEEREREKLVNSAKSKLSPEELAALLRK